MAQPDIDSDQIEMESFVDDITDITDGEQVSVEHVNFEIVQNSKMHGIYRKVTVFNDYFCDQIVQTKHHRKYKYRIDLAYLDPRPFRSRLRVWRWLYIALGMLGLDAILLLAGVIDTSSINFLGLFVGLLVVSTMSLLAFFYYSRDRVFFRTQYGKIRLVELINNNPDRKRFRTFVNNFVMQINKTKTARGFNQAKYLARELKELRRLTEEAVIPVKSYEKAKQLIFKHKAFTNA